MMYSNTCCTVLMGGWSNGHVDLVTVLRIQMINLKLIIHLLFNQFYKLVIPLNHFLHVPIQYEAFFMYKMLR